MRYAIKNIKFRWWSVRQEASLFASAYVDLGLVIKGLFYFDLLYRDWWNNKTKKNSERHHIRSSKDNLADSLYPRRTLEKTFLWFIDQIASFSFQWMPKKITVIVFTHYKFVWNVKRHLFIYLFAERHSCCAGNKWWSGHAKKLFNLVSLW